LKPIALLVHVPNVKLGLEWYKKAFPMAVETNLEHSDYTVLNINGFSIELVPADDKVGTGKYGTVMYWLVDSLNESQECFYALGAKLYRGPMNIENGLSICQLEDPFGNLIGLRGKIT
jgi:predicted enzyme related to lactoylglutathione lyase